MPSRVHIGRSTPCSRAAAQISARAHTAVVNHQGDVSAEAHASCQCYTRRIPRSLLKCNTHPHTSLGSWHRGEGGRGHSTAACNEQWTPQSGLPETASATRDVAGSECDGGRRDGGIFCVARLLATNSHMLHRRADTATPCTYTHLASNLSRRSVRVVAAHCNRIVGPAGAETSSWAAPSATI